MSELLDPKKVDTIREWENKLAELQDYYSDFSQKITEYDKEDDEDKRNEIRDKATEINEEFNEKYKLLSEKVSDFNIYHKEFEEKYDELEALYNSAYKKGYLKEGEKTPDGKKIRDEIKKAFRIAGKPSIVDLNNMVVDKMNALNAYLDGNLAKFGLNGAFIDLSGKMENRGKQFGAIIKEKENREDDDIFKTPMKTPMKRPKDGFEPIPFPELPMPPSKQEEIRKMLEDPEMKNQLIDKIIKTYPTFKKDQLDALDTKDLLEISVVLGFNFNQLDQLKAPENASKEVKELAQNLENIKREREIQDEFKKLKESVQGEEAQTSQEKKKESMKKVAKKIKKSLPKEAAFKVDDSHVSGVPHETQSATDIKKKHLQNLIAAGNISLEDNLKDILLSSETKKKKKKQDSKPRKENAYLTFMKTFREQNAGKFDGKSMMKEGAKAWNAVKSAGGSGTSSLTSSVPVRNLGSREDPKVVRTRMGLNNLNTEQPEDSNFHNLTREGPAILDNFTEFRKLAKNLKKKNDVDDENKADTTLARYRKKNM